MRLANVIVERFKEHSVIRAWDLGNECNVMGAATREQAWVWTAGWPVRSAVRIRPEW